MSTTKFLPSTTKNAIPIASNSNKYFFTQTCYFAQILFFGHNIWTRNARKPIKGSKDSDVA